MKKIILTGGGTVGHISPVVAVIEILKKNARVDYVYIGSRSGPEKEICQKKAIKFRGIFVGKKRNYFSLSDVLDVFKMILGLIQTYFIFIRFKPDLVFAKGGYVTFPILYWTRHFNIPLVIHESDAKMGRANFWASGFARKICVGFPVENYRGQNLPFNKLVYTGIPIAREFFTSRILKNQRHQILITGGSQGSRKINDLVLEISPHLVEKYEVFHLCGEKNLDEIASKFQDEHYHPLGFSLDMPKLMGQADLVLARAGASTLAEISALGKAAILVPLPSAAADHQNLNAKIYGDKNAAVVVSEKNLTASSLLSIIKNLMEDDKFRDLLGHHAREFATKEAAQEIIEIFFKEFELPEDK